MQSSQGNINASKRYGRVKQFANIFDMISYHYFLNQWMCVNTLFLMINVNKIIMEQTSSILILVPLI